MSFIFSQITGKICPHQLTAAIKEAYKANEAAMSRIVLEHGIYGLYWKNKRLRYYEFNSDRYTCSLWELYN